MTDRLGSFLGLTRERQIELAAALVGRMVRVELHARRAPAWAGGELVGFLLAVGEPLDRGRPVLVVADHRWEVPRAVSAYWVTALRPLPRDWVA